MFDVKPVTLTGEVDVAKIEAVMPVINLRAAEAATPPVTLAIAETTDQSKARAIALVQPERDLKTQLHAHFSQALQETTSPQAILAAVGGELYSGRPTPSPRRNLVPTNLELDLSGQAIIPRLSIRNAASVENLINLTEIGSRANFQPKNVSKPLAPRAVSYAPTLAGKEVDYWINNSPSKQEAALAELTRAKFNAPQPAVTTWMEKRPRLPQYKESLLTPDIVNAEFSHPGSQTTVLAPVAPIPGDEKHRQKSRHWASRSRNCLGACGAVPPGGISTKKQHRHWDVKSRWLFGAAGLIVLVGVGAHWNDKDKVLQSSSQAVDNLETAKTDIANFQFAKAANSFALAYDNFSEASGTLNLLGSSLTAWLGDVPGLEQLKSAKNVIEVGQEMSAAGEQVALALEKFYQTNWTSFMGYQTGKRPQSLVTLVSEFRQALVFAQEKVNHSGQLLAVVETETLPADKQAQFGELKAKLPDLQGFIDNAVEYTDWLIAALGEEAPKKYLLMFENNSELRPTGGFPGSYALIGFNRGLLSDLKVDDIYNIDGQAKENIVPPKELQHITPTWGMRDANWFTDFPTSAKKIMEFYQELNGGPEVDGVIAITPTIITRILEVTGPIDLPEYSLRLDSNNFVATIQNEVEYGDNRAQPKQVVVDFVPRFIKKLSQQDKAQWTKILQIILGGVDEKQVLAYFADPKLEAVVVKNNLAGEVKTTEGDYLSIVHTNVKGSKTDAVIDNSYNLEVVQLEDGSLEHTLKITRTHKGGREKYGFYNRKNPDWVRVLVPANAKFIGIDGNTRVAYQPLISYALGEFKHDPDLTRYEANRERLSGGVESFNETGKKVFAFWLETEPQQSRTVTLRYITPPASPTEQYLLLWQKQAGVIGEQLTFSFDPSIGKQVIYQYPELDLRGEKLVLQQLLNKDLAVGIKFQ